MKDQKPSLNQMNELELSTGLFKEKLKSARIKSAIVAAIPTIFIQTVFMTSAPFEGSIAANLIALFVLTIVPFTFSYELVFNLGFGKALAPTLRKRKRFFESAPFMQQRNNSAIDAYNAANGYGPGIGFMMPKKHTD